MQAATRGDGTSVDAGQSRPSDRAKIGGRTHRDLAIKVLPELPTRGQERVLRFEREAKLLASLNQSNIASHHFGLFKAVGPESSVRLSARCHSARPANARHVTSLI
ncbi:MAG: hypothetical protein ACYSUI_07045 [Planctomycetota bacterium]|jgi:hypothetical protein